MKKYFFLVPLAVGALATRVQAAWTPLIQASDFTGIQADLLTTAAGIISLVIIVLAVGIIIKVFT